MAQKTTYITLGRLNEGRPQSDWDGEHWRFVDREKDVVVAAIDLNDLWDAFDDNNE